MKLGLTFQGLAAQFARRRIARARDEAVRAALQSLAAKRQQQADRQDDRGGRPSDPSTPDKQPRS